MDAAQAELKAMEGGPAIFSDDRRHRYALTRVWDESRSLVAWIGLNPSTADEEKLDPTLRRVLRFTHGWGYGGFIMLNAFSLRTKDPFVMMRDPEPNTPENDQHLVTECSRAGLVIACWGAHGFHRNRSTEVRGLMDGAGVELSALALTNRRQPRHPLYLSADLMPQALEIA